MSKSSVGGLSYTEVREQLPVGSLWTHRNGDDYMVVGYCKIERTWRRGVLYAKLYPQDNTDFDPVERDAEEFLDGRFTRLLTES